MPFFLILGILLVPTLIMTLHIDFLSPGVVNSAVQRFVDDARCSGKITVADYERLVNKVNSAQPLCDISIIHEKEAYVLQGDDLDRYYDAYNEDVILDVLYPDSGSNGVYYMAAGDYLSVVVKNTTPTLGMEIMSIFTPQAKMAVPILCTYGNRVGENGLTNME